VVGKPGSQGVEILEFKAAPGSPTDSRHHLVDVAATRATSLAGLLSTNADPGNFFGEAGNIAAGERAT
jgi:hypothetical protein